MRKYLTVVIVTQLILFSLPTSYSTDSPNEAQRIQDRFQPPIHFRRTPSPPGDGNLLAELAKITEKYQSVDLGTGHSNVPITKLLSYSMANAVQNETALFNQYTPSSGGLLRLRQAISKFYSPLIGRELNINNELLITAGATSALEIAVRSHIEVGDEVIIIEPYYPGYPNMVKYAGGIARYVSLKPDNSKEQRLTSSADWKLDWTELEQTFNSKTKMLILNNPLNPLGKMFTRFELERIAELCQRWNVVVLADEVYDYLPLGGRQHIRFCTLPGMWERTITVGSSSKTFSVTGWRIGWVYGPSYLLATMFSVQGTALLFVSTPAQEAIAIAFENEIANWGTSQSYLSNISSEIQEKIYYLANALYQNGFRVIIPEGTYYLVIDWSPLKNQIDLTKETGTRLAYRFLKWFAREVGIRGGLIWFTNSNLYLGEHLIRLCLYKTNETLSAAADRVYNYEF